LIDIDDVRRLDLIINKYEKHQDKKKFYINELICKYNKLRWTPENIIENKMVLAGNLAISFTDTINKNTSILIQYYVKL
jgi:hypothetical protein